MGAVMFVLFKSALTSRPLFVNPSLVRIVVDGDQMAQVKICFDDQHSVTVQGTATQNCTKIDGRIGADRAVPRIVSPGGFDAPCRAVHLAFEQDTPSALIGTGGLSTGGTGMGFGGSCIGLGSCGRTGGLPGGLGFPGCPPMSKLRSDFARERKHRLTA